MLYAWASSFPLSLLLCSRRLFPKLVIDRFKFAPNFIVLETVWIPEEFFSAEASPHASVYLDAVWRERHKRCIQ